MSQKGQATLNRGTPVSDARGKSAHKQARRYALLAGILAVSLVVALFIGWDRAPDRVSAPGSNTDAPPGITWLSGASGEGVASGEFATWRGNSLGIAGTWADNEEGMVELPQLRPGGEFASWNESLDIAIGAFDEGGTWAEAADGAYDERWRESLTNLRQLWGERDGTLFLRFAHEFNGDWYPWAVDSGSYESFIVAWQRFRALQQDIFPEAELVFCVNRESVGHGMDWREAFPGSEYVDVMAVDYYNNFPYVDSQEDWVETVMAVDSFGAPEGIERHLEFARSVGLPLAVPEWSGNALEGDSPAFIEYMHAFFAENAGDGAGEVLYDILFNVDGYDGKFILYPETLMPESAATYQRLW